MDPFANRVSAISGPATDAVPVTPDDTNDLADVALALYIETGGIVVLDTVDGNTRTIVAADFMILPLGTRRVRATGTTALGIHALTIS